MKKEKDPSGLEGWRKGETRLRITRMDKDGKRAVFHATKAELDERTKRLQAFLAIRSELRLSQSEIAAALRVATSTVQGWEIGRRLIPESTFTLAELLRDMPAVRKRLLAA
jgi:DNA-binding transcriptional regulator YiaG